MFLNRAVLYLRMIKISHSVFALPFAFTGAVLAASGVPSLHQIIWIVIAMVGARSGAMGLNRIIDRNIDKENPRTRDREIPAGKIKVFDAAVFTFISFVLMVFSAYQLNMLCFWLSPLAIAVLFIYSYTKRFTWLSHFFLGFAISGAPMGAWIAVRGTFDLEILPLCIGVIFWLAGFDILYAMQDVDFDRREGLHSIPRRFGIKRSLIMPKLFHSVTISMLIANGFIFHLGIAYWIGILLVSGLLIYEHSLVKQDDLSKLDMAFFNMNGYISITVFVFTFLSLMLR